MPQNAECRERFRKLLKVDEEIAEQHTATAEDKDEPANFLAVENKDGTADFLDTENITRQGNEEEHVWDRHPHVPAYFPAETWASC